MESLRLFRHEDVDIVTDCPIGIYCSCGMSLLVLIPASESALRNSGRLLLLRRAKSMSEQQFVNFPKDDKLLLPNRVVELHWKMLRRMISALNGNQICQPGRVDKLKLTLDALINSSFSQKKPPQKRSEAAPF
jgi:hypothetical protein